jgi:hypothetical protein
LLSSLVLILIHIDVNILLCTNDQTKWRGRMARKWMHRERKRWKKAARSLHAEVFANWFDNTDRYVHDHEVKNPVVPPLHI